MLWAYVVGLVVALFVFSLFFALGVLSSFLDPLKMAIVIILLAVFLLYVVAEAIAGKVGLARDQVIFKWLFSEHVIRSQDIVRARFDSPPLDAALGRGRKRMVLELQYREAKGRRRPSLIADLSEELMVRIARVLDPIGNPGDPFEPI
jgi:hypothetical protein